MPHAHLRPPRPVASRYLVTNHGFAESEHPTLEQAIARASMAGGDARVVCVEGSQEYETRQTVWPTVGPVYAASRQ